MKATQDLKTRRGKVTFLYSEIVAGYGHSLSIHSGNGMCVSLVHVEPENFRAVLQGLIDQIDAAEHEPACKCERCAEERHVSEVLST